MREQHFAWKGARECADFVVDFILSLFMAFGCMFVIKLDQIAERACENRRHRRPF